MCRKYEANGKIKRVIGCSLVHFVINKNKECVGALFVNDSGEFVPIKADAVVIASGGPNKLFGKTTGSVLNDGSCEGIALSQGVELGNLEMIQYHPTTIKTKVKNMLITEACRGEGGKLYTLREGKKWCFMDEWYPKIGELMPRDIVSRSIYKVCNEMKLGINGENKVYLDISMLPSEVIDKKLHETCEICEKYLCLDVHRYPIPVYPGVNYFMGGIKTDETHRTNIKRLFASGECSCQYHGANRVGGNSLLGVVFRGIMSAKYIKNIHKASEKEKEDEMNKVLNEEKLCRKQWKMKRYKNSIDIWKVEDMLSYIMNKSMGIIRDEKELINSYNGLENLESFCHKIKGSYMEYKSLLMKEKRQEVLM
ncbi:MAG: FAD-binding protein [Clostridium sp.]|nr:FAD-binding protein [Clostridium sp.]